MLTEPWCNGTLLGRIPTTSGGDIRWLLSLGCNRKAGSIFLSFTKEGTGLTSIVSRKKKEKRKKKPSGLTQLHYF